MSPARRPGPKVLAIVVAAVVASPAAVAAWLALVEHHRALERHLLDFCQPRHVGRPIAGVAREAARAGLRPDGGMAGGEDRELIAYEMPSVWLPVASVCTLRLDTGTVASVSFDPWYH